jgi:hypothetical protein
MHAYNEAIRDWEHYLRVDASGDWAAEAQRRLSELREKMKAHDKPSATLHSDPGEATPILRRARPASLPRQHPGLCPSMRNTLILSFANG